LLSLRARFIDGFVQRYGILRCCGSVVQYWGRNGALLCLRPCEPAGVCPAPYFCFWCSAR
jgi:hypothetical protein